MKREKTQREAQERRLEKERLINERKRLDLLLQDQHAQNQKELLVKKQQIRNANKEWDVRMKENARARESDERARRIQAFANRHSSTRPGHFPSIDRDLQTTQPQLAEALAAYYRERATRERQASIAASRAAATQAAMATAVPDTDPATAIPVAVSAVATPGVGWFGSGSVTACATGSGCASTGVATAETATGMAVAGSVSGTAVAIAACVAAARDAAIDACHSRVARSR